MTGRRLALIGLALILSAAACRAEELAMTPPDPAASDGASDRVLATEEVFGLYGLRRAGGEGACRIALNRVPTDGGFGVVIGRCDLEVVRGAKAWKTVQGGFELLRETGGPLRFRQTGVDDFETIDGAYRLSRTPMV